MGLELHYARREWDWDVSNLAAGRKQRLTEGRSCWLSRAAALLPAAEREPKAPHLVDFIRMMLHTGMCTGELLGLEWRRVDLKVSLIYLEAAHQKSGKVGSVPLNLEIIKNKLVGVTRFERATPASRRQCSTRLSYTPYEKVFQ